jgi:hypothetical protein
VCFIFMSELNAAAPVFFPLRIQVLDPDLPLLASQAALELDNLLLGEKVEPMALRQLGKALKNSFTGTGSTPRKSLVDPGVVAVIGRALNASDVMKSASTVDELDNKAWEVVGQMDQIGEHGDSNDVKKVRDFCVALSDYAASYRQALSDADPVPPYRR